VDTASGQRTINVTSVHPDQWASSVAAPHSASMRERRQSRNLRRFHHQRCLAQRPSTAGICQGENWAVRRINEVMTARDSERHCLKRHTVIAMLVWDDNGPDSGYAGLPVLRTLESPGRAVPLRCSSRGLRRRRTISRSSLAYMENQFEHRASARHMIGGEAASGDAACSSKCGAPALILQPRNCAR